MADLAAHAPSIFGGVLIGVLAFVPLLLVLLPVWQGRRRADMLKGSLMVGLSFIVLAAGLVAVHVSARTETLPFAVGELVGVLACWIILAIATVLRRD